MHYNAAEHYGYMVEPGRFIPQRTILVAVTLLANSAVKPCTALPPFILTPASILSFEHGFLSTLTRCTYTKLDPGIIPTVK